MQLVLQTDQNTALRTPRYRRQHDPFVGQGQMYAIGARVGPTAGRL